MFFIPAFNHRHFRNCYHRLNQRQQRLHNIICNNNDNNTNERVCENLIVETSAVGAQNEDGTCILMSDNLTILVSGVSDKYYFFLCLGLMISKINKKQTERINKQKRKEGKIITGSQRHFVGYYQFEEATLQDTIQHIHYSNLTGGIIRFNFVEY